MRGADVAFDQSAAIQEVSVYHSPRSSMMISERGLPEIAFSFSVSSRHASSETGSTSLRQGGGVISPVVARDWVIRSSSATESSGKT